MTAVEVCMHAAEEEIREREAQLARSRKALLECAQQLSVQKYGMQTTAPSG